MSMLGVTLLNEIINGKHILMPDQIIENLRQGIIKSLKQVAEEDSIKDGMDIAVCVVISIEIFYGMPEPIVRYTW